MTSFWSVTRVHCRTNDPIPRKGPNVKFHPHRLCQTLFLSAIVALISGCEPSDPKQQTLTEISHEMALTEATPDVSLITVTSRAKEEFQGYLANHQGACVKLDVREGGCTGFIYSLDIAPLPRDKDFVIDRSNGFPLAYSVAAVDWLKGMTIGWEESEIRRGFRFDNPNATVEDSTEQEASE